ncbi:hypothetical protein Aple_066550 [Acrocarpospora pleiomorpha]|uniref:Uncharacterized protein n=1 Tax=Acrocarpospora pleiomorpha TaxID=90975 RepID=A0A5M3XSI4_9ACTN|nr:hypothetical protein Aple_066550 [Acrocarpospora pleiomorpha]
MTPFHQIAVPPHDGIRPDEEPQPTKHVAGQRCQESGEEGSVLGREPHPGVGAELPFENGDLVTQGEDLDVLIPISHRQQPQRGESVRDGQVGQTKEHDRSSCRTGSSSGIEACLQEKPCKAVTWTDGIIGRRTVRPAAYRSGRALRLPRSAPDGHRGGGSAPASHSGLRELNDTPTHEVQK